MSKLEKSISEAVEFATHRIVETATSEVAIDNLLSEDLGTFDVVSGALRISDPCYKNDAQHRRLAGTIKAASGSWRAVSYTRQFGEPYSLLGRRVCELEAFRDECRNVGEPYSHEKLPYKHLRFPVWVDSAQAGIFDLSHFQDESLVTPDTTTELCDNWYWMCCDVTLSCEAGIVPFGVVSNSGWGDGLYTAYAKRNSKGEAVAVKIVFIAGDDEE